MQRVVTELPIHLRIRDEEHSFESASLELEIERLPDGAFCAVTSNQISSFNSQSCTVRMLSWHSYAAVILMKAFQLSVPTNVFFMAEQVVIEQPFIFALLKHQDEGVGAEAFTDA